MNTRKHNYLFAALLTVLTLSGCGDDSAEAPQRPRGVLITATTLETASIERRESTVGRLESKADPDIAAEVSGRVLEVRAEVGDRVTKGQVLATIDAEDYRLDAESARAEIGRLQAMIEQQQRLVNRYEALKEDDFFPENTLDEAQSQLRVLGQQLTSARARLARAERDFARTDIRAPVTGRIQERLIDQGDYVSVGATAFLLSTDELLRVVLPYPEQLADAIKVGQRVLLSIPLAPKEKIEAEITEIRPAVGSTNRAIDAIVDLPNPGHWKPGGSVNGSVVLERHDDAIVIPELSLVLRPKGTVVYVVRGDNTVEERLVTPGIQFEGKVEVLEGLEIGERIAVEGAAFLSEGAPVRFADSE